eukprot:TRINITY_DN15056_c0_g2_i2.p4 TRINITY_DN15056_c0_g2~~TRINITY_DN15056_c0_g2_i2.p4  ORF type:complete len:105 (+),score=33.30 TRINITY_DN15056_c0_g2_i2:1083-1397(+)
MCNIMMNEYESIKHEANISLEIIEQKLNISKDLKMINVPPLRNYAKSYNSSIKSKTRDQIHRNQRYCSLNLSLIHISEPTRPLYISYAVFCLKKKKKKKKEKKK